MKQIKISEKGLRYAAEIEKGFDISAGFENAIDKAIKSSEFWPAWKKEIDVTKNVKGHHGQAE